MQGPRIFQIVVVGNNDWSQTQRVKIENLHLEGEIPFGSLVFFLVVVSVRQVVFSECKTSSPVNS